MVPDPVLEYIRAQRLYAKGDCSLHTS
jgi:hypothetical protein